eukprot:6381861-Amphidinium_carterae.1
MQDVLWARCPFSMTWQSSSLNPRGERGKISRFSRLTSRSLATSKLAHRTTVLTAERIEKLL